jgi:hypothetical protein
MDLQSITLAGLFVIGVVNVVTFFKPILDSRVKFAISFVAAFVALLIPADLGAYFLNIAKQAIETAFIASGGYKLLTKAGGK